MRALLLAVVRGFARSGGSDAVEGGDGSHSTHLSSSQLSLSHCLPLVLSSGSKLLLSSCTDQNSKPVCPRRIATVIGGPDFGAWGDLWRPAKCATVTFKPCIMFFTRLSVFVARKCHRS